MATITSLPQEIIDQITASAYYVDGPRNRRLLKDLRLVSRSFWNSASRILFRAFSITMNHAGDTDPERPDGIQRLMELLRSGASRYILSMRVSGRYRESYDKTKEKVQAETITKGLQGHTRPALEALDLYHVSDSMLHELSQPAMAPTIAGLRYLTVWGCLGRSKGAEVKQLLQYGVSLQAVQWDICLGFFEGPSGIVNPKAPLERLRLSGNEEELVASLGSLLGRQ